MRHRGTHTRRAFTLLELLVVLSIIVLLATLSAGATLKFIAVQHRTTTQLHLNKLQTQIDRQWGDVVRRAKDDPIPESLRSNPDFAAIIGTDPHAQARARVVYIKLKTRQMFPQTFDEAVNPYPLPALSTYVRFLGKLGVNGSASATMPYESSICLLMALSRATGDGGVKVEDLGLPTAMLTLPSGAQVAYLVDSWESPMVFARWPRGCRVLNPNGAQPGRNDPGDPDGLLNDPAWLATPSVNLFRRLCHDIPSRQKNAGTSSFKLEPMVVSAGPDRKLDLDLMTLAELGQGSADNLYSGGGS